MLKHLIWGVACCCSFLSAQTVAQPGSGDSFQFDITVGYPALAAFVRDALNTHPQVSAAEVGVVAGEALEQAASRPLFNPEIGVDFESADTNDRVFVLSQTLDVAGQRDGRRAVASAERQVAEQRLAAARRDLTVELLSTLAEYWATSELDDLGMLRIDLMQRFAEVAQQRQRAGDFTQVALNVANLAYAQARIERAATAAALAETEQLLEALTPAGGTGGWPRLPAELTAIRLSDAASIGLVATVPEVRIQQERLAVAEAAVTLRDRERRANPTLSLMGGEEQDESLIGLSFSMPLNVRNRLQYEVSAARASRLQAERELDNVTIRAQARLQAATQRYTLTKDALRQWSETGAPNLAEQAELIDRLWQAGELEVTDYLVQLDQTLDTQASALELQRRLWLAWFEWLAAAGQVGTWLGLPIEMP